ncbi:MAG: hypothetical protein KME45_25585 [Stenomitos rutilans HA7619-LM2]|jgi:hypothetical protein|nr:hypothetical protein [Stenomitos rutilans HA7619-LM2]
MTWLVLTLVMLLSLALIGLLELPFSILHTISVPGWLPLLGAIALLSWCLDD